jgi:iron uptake system EfeUOB component EfeO/EfeM
VVVGARLQAWGAQQREAEDKWTYPVPRRLALLTAMLTCGLAAMGCGLTATSHPTGSQVTTRARLPSLSKTPSRSVQNASLSATEGYRRFVVESAQLFVSDTESLQGAIASGNLAAAESSELAAQTEYDQIRPQVKWGAQAGLDLDGQADQFPPGTPFVGLHRIEQGLWKGTVPETAVAALVARGPAIQFSLTRATLTPQLIIEGDVQELDWVDSAAVPGREEIYSHLDTIDVDAGVNAAQTGFKLVEQLGDLIAAKQTYVVAAQFESLSHALSALGTAGAKPDFDIPTADWLAVGQQVDATASALAVLASQLGSAGTGAGYGSYGRY